MPIEIDVISTSGQGVGISGQYVYQGSGAHVVISGQAVLVSGQPVGVSGETVVIESGLHVISESGTGVLVQSGIHTLATPTAEGTDAKLVDITNLNVRDLLEEILKELKKQSLQLSLITDEEISKEDL